VQSHLQSGAGKPHVYIARVWLQAECIVSMYSIDSPDYVPTVLVRKYIHKFPSAINMFKLLYIVRVMMEFSASITSITCTCTFVNDLYHVHTHIRTHVCTMNLRLQHYETKTLHERLATCLMELSSNTSVISNQSGGLISF